MPPLTRACIKAALIWLVIALLVGVATAVPGTVRTSTIALAIRPTAVHMLTVGWITQLIFGVALWMFPRSSREQPYGNAALGWTLFAALNGGLLLRAIAEPAVMLRPSAGAGIALGLSGLLQWVAGVAFVLLVWPRVKVR